MPRKIRTYESDELIVEYDAKRCIHAAECVHGLPSVFDPESRPWISPQQGDSADLMQVIERCPTGALQYRRKDEQPGEVAPETNSVRVSAGGPVYLRGDLRITLPDGEVLRETRAALCRCGQSGDKPFCDNSHIEAGFDEPGGIAENRLVVSETAGEGPLEITLAANGPVLIRGPVGVTGTDGQTVEGVSGALCRCGHSASKPFCDGSHKAAGFTAE